jgi:F-type H+-transporting ATPase subunit a
MFRIFGIEISDSVFSGFVVVIALLIFAAIVRIWAIPRFKNVPKGFQMFLEGIVTMFDNMSKNITGHLSGLLGPYTFGAAAYICFGVLIETVGLRPVIADINACFALALCTFILINTLAIKEHGMGGRIKYFFQPVKFVAPIKLITDCAVPVSMTFRLFGSILSGMIMMELVYAVLPYVLPAFLTPLFTLFHAVIQSYIFAALTLTFIAEATE